MTPEAPMTLQFSPDNIELPELDNPNALAIVQHSHREGGRIFLCANPLGEPMGIHLLPEDAAKIRDHLTFLLMDGAGDTPADIRAELERAASRVKHETKHTRRKTPKQRWAQFKFEFAFGPFKGIITRLND